MNKMEQEFVLKEILTTAYEKQVERTAMSCKTSVTDLVKLLAASNVLDAALNRIREREEDDNS